MKSHLSINRSNTIFNLKFQNNKIIDVLFYKKLKILIFIQSETYTYL